MSNYFTNQLRPYDYNAVDGPGRSQLQSTNRLYATVYWNKRQEDRYNWAQDASNATDGGIINGFAVTKGFDYRTNVGVTARLHVDAVRRRCCSTCAVSGRAFRRVS